MSDTGHAVGDGSGTAAATVELEALIAERAGLARMRAGKLALPGGVADADLEALVSALLDQYGSMLKAVLLYGSYARGARDSLVDLYVLTDGPVLSRWHRWANALLPPNVYHLQAPAGIRCKYAMLPLRHFLRRLRVDLHPYFWARFAQPCHVLYVADESTIAPLLNGFSIAVTRMLEEARRGLTAPVPARDLWAVALGHTYRCELRSERGNRPAQLVQANRHYLSALADAWQRRHHPEASGGEGGAAPLITPAAGAWRWPIRRLWGKGLSVARLLKAAFTFNDGLDYLLWKIERHSGIYIAPSPLQRRWPLLFAWPLFWRLYRRGAFR